MYLIRAISALAVFGAAVFCSSKLLGTMSLNDVMSMDEQQKTGVAKLTDAQKRELELWINNKFVLKTTTPAAQQVVYLEQNIQGGSQLVFSDGSIYAISPADRPKVEFWLTPIAIKIEPSGDPQYPSKITNTLTNVSVNGKMVTPGRPKQNLQQ
jgi:hypothetical protein